jgi:hypothetical protein
MDSRQLIKKLLIKEVERMEPNVQSFENNPIAFILNKYPSLTETLEMLMTTAYKDYITGIYIIAPKPTTFKIVLHNDQDFLLTYLGKAYEASVAGKTFYLQTIGEKERCMRAITRLLTLGNPIQNKGPEGGADAGEAEPQSAEEEAPPAEAAAGETES